MTETAFNLCNCMHFSESGKAECADFSAFLQGSDHFANADRLYVGANFCARYFLRYLSSAMEELSAKGFFGKKVTLVLPIFSEEYLSAGKDLISKTLRTYADFVDEITANDAAMLLYVKDAFPSVVLNVGRLMNKDARDIRYDDNYNAPYTPAALTVGYSLFEGIKDRIGRFEFDLVRRFLKLNNPFGIKAAVYYPYVYQTTGNICETAGIHRPIDGKFRASGACAFECADVILNYTSREGGSYVKVGKTVYFEEKDFSAEGEDVRLIYEPIEEVLLWVRK